MNMPAGARLAAICILVLGGSAVPGFSLTIREVKIAPFEVDGVCQAIDGEHPVSIQAGVQYRMSGEDDAGIALYGDPGTKEFQSFECGETKATIYYYEYGSKDELSKRLGGIKAVLWGEPGPTTLHPELVVPLDNVLAVVSSRNPQFLAALLSHRIDFPDLPDAVVDDRIEKLRCGTRKEKTPELCGALQGFRRGTYPVETGTEMVLIGRAWEISEESESSEALNEALFIGRAESGLVAGFGAFLPENDEERQMVVRQTEAQKEGKVAESAQGLIDYLRETYGGTEARARKTGDRSLAFIGLGNRVYLRSSGGTLVLVTKLMHEEKEQPYVVAAFQIGATATGTSDKKD